MADSAEPHRLYEDAVQCVEAEIDFADETFASMRGRKAASLREDFCGTMNTSCEWVRRRSGNSAIAIDLNEEVLDWGRSNNLSQLDPEQAKNIEVIKGDVLEVTHAPVDITLAMNFSYWVFKDRTTMLDYFRRVHAALVEDGIFFLDIFGGYEAFREMEESTKHSGFTYIWDQADYNPITGDYTCHIHFKFRDGSRLMNAFTYHWRLWTLPELTELLGEAGFRPVVYWDVAEDDDDNDYRPVTSADADAGWIAYIVAQR